MKKKLNARQVKRLLDFLDREEARCIEMSIGKGKGAAISTGKAEAYGMIAVHIRSLIDEDIQE